MCCELYAEKSCYKSRFNSFILFCCVHTRPSYLIIHFFNIPTFAIQKEQKKTRMDLEVVLVCAGSSIRIGERCCVYVKNQRNRDSSHISNITFFSHLRRVINYRMKRNEINLYILYAWINDSTCYFSETSSRFSKKIIKKDSLYICDGYFELCAGSSKSSR